ncbi:argininosuccinate lyase [Fusarium oxysporum f. sp. radicis-lycopersici 26381]|uniref:Arginosuccinase n=3 Tax=Fusarium oxysporum TaxID=5507 RepID=W9J135_FUSOX|nr:argininosuccinate lyase [Fusarium oxysporum f. sp. lycopersici 4287]XP_018235133.1 argininosuccinate lyase [Fusarium oxysporum f. sp. lycopersici 4287]EWY98470.1 argininosuccinate lyase [Fusarium oxysporum NRRL 32931]EWZ98577.1 argininosuccinate lyase [Fusarium oxysporum f. sp. lycopersici MN25]EXK41912.1 argininosuccinate lyase [Fusarium oxysporum f. sp. melonis 26406]EXL61873.1 argininosuccinate lyase [Fusarium oxysporum f. sp. radicis-lycopersici 26381]EWY98471.1 argininosuccinate lyase
MMKTFILQTSVDWESLSERTPLASCIQVAAATSRSFVICACGYVTASVKSTANSLLSYKSSPNAPRLKCKPGTTSEQSPLLSNIHSDYLMPGYTHLQRAQPVRWGQWIMSHAASFKQDLERLRQVFERVNLSPLGCGALAGNVFGIDRDAIAAELGFSGITLNSMNTSGDRDFIIEFLSWNSIFTSHISRWAEDLILYSTSEFGFCRLSDLYSTGSSLMPNKKNADSLELLRGKSGRAFGQMAGLMMSVKGLPTCYNKDLQEGWEPMLDSVQTVLDSLGIANGVIATMTVRPERMLAALDKTMLATDVAEWLVRNGCPFREAHHISGRVVALSENTETPMDKLTLEQLQAIDSRFTADIVKAFEYESSVEAKSARGGTSRSAVLQQIQELHAILD